MSISVAWVWSKTLAPTPAAFVGHGGTLAERVGHARLESVDGQPEVHEQRRLVRIQRIA